MYILGVKIILFSSGVNPVILFCVTKKNINILRFFIKPISVCYFHAVKAGDFIYTAFVSLNYRILF